MFKAIQAMCLFAALSMAGQSALADDYSDAIQAFRDAGESAAFFDGSYGYAVFPTVGKGGIGIGGAYGEGKVFVGGQPVGNSTMAQVTIGFQLGGQAFSQIIFFEDERAFREFTSGNFEFSAEATGVLITAGASAKANTGGGVTAGASGGRNDATNVHGGFRKGMAIFTIARGGLMYEASLGGQKFSYTPL